MGYKENGQDIVWGVRKMHRIPCFMRCKENEQKTAWSVRKIPYMYRQENQGCFSKNVTKIRNCPSIENFKK